MLARWYAYIGRRRLLIGLGSAVAVTLAAAIPGVIAGSGSSTHVHSASAVPAAGEASIVQPPPPGVGRRWPSAGRTVSWSLGTKPSAVDTANVLLLNNLGVAGSGGETSAG